jgi:hypothetical protein
MRVDLHYLTDLDLDLEFSALQCSGEDLLKTCRLEVRGPQRAATGARDYNPEVPAAMVTF